MYIDTRVYGSSEEQKSGSDTYKEKVSTDKSLGCSDARNIGIDPREWEVLEKIAHVIITALLAGGTKLEPDEACSVAAGVIDMENKIRRKFISTKPN